MKKTIARKLRELRGEKRQKEIAAGLGVNLDKYERWERGESEPSAEWLLKIKQYYKLLAIDNLLTD